MTEILVDAIGFANLALVSPDAKSRFIGWLRVLGRDAERQASPAEWGKQWNQFATLHQGHGIRKISDDVLNSMG